MDTAFHRPPRDFPAPVPAEQLTIAAPPALPERHGDGVMSILFTVLGSCGLLAFAIVYDNKLFLYIALGMLALSILLAFGMRWSHRRSGRRAARRRRQRYREYLRGIEERLEKIARLQLAAALRRHPDPVRLHAIATAREHLWERRPEDGDFLSVRAGRGPVRHAARPAVDRGHDPLAEVDEALVAEAEEVARTWDAVPDVPVAVALAAAPVLAIVGPAGRAQACVRALLAQIAVAHAPSDVRIAIAPRDGGGGWEWAKWLPHVRAESLGRDAVAAPRVALAADAAGLAALLEEHVAPRIEQLRALSGAFGSVGAGTAAASGRRAPAALTAPWLVLAIEGLHPADPRARMPLLREVLARGADLRVALVCTVERAGDEPAETRARLRLADGGEPATLEETGAGGYVQAGVAVDEATVAEVEAIARTLAPVRLQEHARAAAADASDGLLGLLGLPAIDALDVHTEWARRPRSLALRATIGVDATGERIELDLKQAAEGGMGPHGLIIGATGSGKSELLRTLVTSLALAHPPDELAFVFVDFKGGAAFAELDALPHAAGMITNLASDARLVERMRAALQGEQERRQRVLRDAGNADDVLAYRRLREIRPQLPPLPDLIVVIDEFGELLAAHPDFLDLFVAIGRVGRSLGIHLLFSSQRFDEGRLRGLESHVRYRVCLRTFSPAESKAVLGTPDAYVLPSEPGLGYLKVDANVYERFRATLVAEPPAARSLHVAGRPAVVAFGGAGIAARVDAERAGGPAAGGDRGDDLRRLVGRLAGAWQGRPAHQVWTAPLPDRIALDELALPAPFWQARAPRGGIGATLGIVDIPDEQRAAPLVLDFAGTAGHVAVVGAPQSGKSTLLRTLVLELARTHTPQELEVLAIDLGGGLLRGLRGLPHVRAIAGKGDRELAQRIVARARAELAEREAALRAAGLDSIADVDARRRAGEPVPFGHLLLVVDGWAALRRDVPDLDFAIEELLGAGLTQGLHVVVSANRWAEMRPSVSDNLGARLELRLNDPIESELGRRAAEALPPGVPGRGLCAGGREFQAALPVLDGGFDAAVATIAAAWTGAPAPPVHVLPAVVSPGDLAPAGAGVAIGVEQERLQTVALDLDGPDAHLLVLGDGESGRTNVLRAFVGGLRGDARVTVVDPRRTLGDVAGLPHVETYATTTTGAAQAANTLAAVAAQRGEQLDRCGEGAVAHAPLYLVVDDYDLLAGPQGNPLAPLVGVLARGRDLGIHVVLARRVAGATRASFEPLFQQLLELRTPGLLLSGDPSEGPLLDGQRAAPLPPGRALLVRRGRAPQLVQIVLAPPGAGGGAQAPRLVPVAGGAR